MGAEEDWEDVKTTFLDGSLEDKVYVYVHFFRTSGTGGTSKHLWDQCVHEAGFWLSLGWSRQWAFTHQERERERDNIRAAYIG